MSEDTTSPAFKWARRQEKKQKEALKELYKLLRENPTILEAYNKAVECGAIK